MTERRAAGPSGVHEVVRHGGGYWQEDLEIEGVDVNGVIESYKDHLFRVTGAGESQMDVAIRQALRPQPDSDAIAEFEREFGAPNA